MTAKQKEERIKKLIEEEKAAREDGENRVFQCSAHKLPDPDPTLIAEVK